MLVPRERRDAYGRPTLSSPYPTLDRADLRAVLDEGPFARSDEGYELQTESMARREVGGRVAPAWGEDPAQLEDVRAALIEVEGVEVGPGGRVHIASGTQATPFGAYASYAVAHDALAERLAQWGMALITCGADPWSKDGRVLEARVRVPFGSPATAPLRSSVAEILAPLSEALFAFSPLREEASHGLRSVGASHRRGARSGGWGPEGSTTLRERFLDWALDAPCAPGPGTFREWLRRAHLGAFPDRADFAAHVARLHSHVLPDRGLVVSAFDAPARAFACVPLVWWSVLLDDAGCLGEIAGWEAPGGARLDRAAQAGLSDSGLAVRARRSFALVADRLLARPGCYASPAMLAAFIAFGQRFTLRARTPADEWLAHFARSRGFALADFAALEERWLALAGIRAAA